MNILYGLYHQTEGEIFLHGKKVDIKNPNVAIEHGVGMVHQHFMLVPIFTVTETLFLVLSQLKEQVELTLQKLVKMLWSYQNVTDYTLNQTKKYKICLLVCNNV